MSHKTHFVGRGGEKLRFALDTLPLNLVNLVAADLGCSVGGFTHCLLNAGVRRVYAVDTGYGTLDWKLRNDPRVVVMERTNALHLKLSEKVHIVTSDVSWTRQKYIVPAALELLTSGGQLLSLFKPQYEAPPELLHRGRIDKKSFRLILDSVLEQLLSQNIPAPEIIHLPAPPPRKNPEAFLVFRKI